MAQTKNTTNIEKLLYQFMGTTNPILSMPEWLCGQMIEAEVSNKIGANKYKQSRERTSHRWGFHPRRPDRRLCTMHLMVSMVRKGGYTSFFISARKHSEAALV